MTANTSSEQAVPPIGARAIGVFMPDSFREKDQMCKFKNRCFEDVPKSLVNLVDIDEGDIVLRSEILARSFGQ